MDPTCEAVCHGVCSGKITPHTFIYHCRPREKDINKGLAAPYDDTIQVLLCEGHNNEIRQKTEINNLPELYGWDETDALDGVTNGLTYTGDSRVVCHDCKFLKKMTVSETGACSSFCERMSRQAPTMGCKCKDSVLCVCASLKNNKLHWDIFTYANGFVWNADYDCKACCSRPCWRDEHDSYFKGLVPVNDIISLAKKTPTLIMEKNSKGHTPLTLIDYIIKEELNSAIAENNEYAKYREDGWARHNIDCLTQIQKELTIIERQLRKTARNSRVWNKRINE